MVYDFHTHTFLSDGSLSPVELIRRAKVNGYRAIAITDHVGTGTVERVVKELAEDCALAGSRWGIIAIPGVEITHVPPGDIPETARRARQAGARLVVVHGETLVEPVEEGTNRAALQCPLVDILAHPGLLGLEDARLAYETGVFLEVSARKGHCLANGHVARMATLAGAPLLVDSDAHDPQDLLTPSLARQVALGAGLDPEKAERALEKNPSLLLRKVGLPI